MRVYVRAAREHDIDLIAWAQQEAARSHLPRGLWDFAFPGPETDRLRVIARVANSSVRSSCHWSGFWIAEVDDRPAAAIAGYAMSPTAAGLAWVSAMQEAVEAERWSVARCDAMWARLAPLWTCSPRTPEGAWVLEWAATRPEHRGKGLLGALLTAAVDEGRRRGHTEVQLSVLIGNLAARRAYERAGFCVVEESLHPDFASALGSPGMWRMSMR